MLILGIESSCDETALAIVRDGVHVVASLVASQTESHEKFGGVVPEIASREHLSVLPKLWKELQTDHLAAMQQLDAIAVTQGPGLVGALLVGSSFGKGLALSRKLPLVPINHVHAHICSAFLDRPEFSEQDKFFPAIALVVSGGHTNLYWMENLTTRKLLGYTLDDACGESFDKVAKMLGMSYPGGPQIERRARLGNAKKYALPKMLARSELNFSYSGLKTAMMQIAQKLKKSNESLSEGEVDDLCAGFQEEALQQLIRKLQLALKQNPEARSMIVCGGVSANQRFRSLFAENFKLPLIYPHLKYCSDNAAMVASLGGYEFRSLARKFVSSSWDVFSRYPFELEL